MVLTFKVWELNYLIDKQSGHTKFTLQREKIRASHFASDSLVEIRWGQSVLHPMIQTLGVSRALSLEFLHEMFTCALNMPKASVLGRHGNMWPGCGLKPFVTFVEMCGLSASLPCLTESADNCLNMLH